MDDGSLLRRVRRNFGTFSSPMKLDQKFKHKSKHLLIEKLVLKFDVLEGGERTKLKYHIKGVGV